MNKLFALIALAVCTLTASAQVETGFRYGFTISGSMNSMTELDGTSSLFGWRIGAIAEWNFTEHFYLGSGFEQTTKGTKIDGIDKGLNYYYFQIPANLGARISLSDKVYLFGQVGPYVSYALNNAKIQILGYGDIEGKRFDWGFNAKVGVEFGEFQIHVGYDLGMAEVWKGTIDWEGKAKQRSLSVGVTYLL